MLPNEGTSPSSIPLQPDPFLIRSFLCFPWGIHYSNCMGFRLRPGIRSRVWSVQRLKTDEHSRVVICVSFSSEDGTLTPHTSVSWQLGWCLNKKRKLLTYVKHKKRVYQIPLWLWAFLRCNIVLLEVWKRPNAFWIKTQSSNYINLHFKQMARLFADGVKVMLYFCLFLTYKMNGCLYSLSK